MSTNANGRGVTSVLRWVRCLVPAVPVLPVALVLLSVLVTACGGASGPDISATEVWARPAMAMDEGESTDSSESGMGPMAGTGAVFMQLENKGGEADRLVGGATDVAKVVEIHETVMEGDVMKMHMLANGLEIPAGGDVLLKPGSYHIMLIGMNRSLKPGDTFSLELQLEKSGALTVEPEVREP